MNDKNKIQNGKVFEQLFNEENYSIWGEFEPQNKGVLTSVGRDKIKYN